MHETGEPQVNQLPNLSRGSVKGMANAAANAPLRPFSNDTKPPPTLSTSLGDHVSFHFGGQNIGVQKDCHLNSKSSNLIWFWPLGPKLTKIGTFPGFIHEAERWWKPTALHGPGTKATHVRFKDCRGLGRSGRSWGPRPSYGPVKARLRTSYTAHVNSAWRRAGDRKVTGGWREGDCSDPNTKTY